MSKSLDDLDPRMRPLAQMLIDHAGLAGLDLVVIDTLRTPEEQTVNIARGVSWTKRSKHLPQLPHGLSLAIDVCPRHLLAVKNWGGPDHPDWLRIGLIGEQLGLKWGGRWKKRDCPHFEYVETMKV